MEDVEMTDEEEEERYRQKKEEFLRMYKYKESQEEGYREI